MRFLLSLFVLLVTACAAVKPKPQPLERHEREPK
jgi:hypothetical protein